MSLHNFTVTYSSYFPLGNLSFLLLKTITGELSSFTSDYHHNPLDCQPRRRRGWGGGQAFIHTDWWCFRNETKLPIIKTPNLGLSKKSISPPLKGFSINLLLSCKKVKVLMLFHYASTFLPLRYFNKFLPSDLKSPGLQFNSVPASPPFNQLLL